MPEALLVIGAIAVLVVSAAYVVTTVRILARSGDIDEPLAEDADEQRPPAVPAVVTSPHRTRR